MNLSAAEWCCAAREMVDYGVDGFEQPQCCCGSVMLQQQQGAGHECLFLRGVPLFKAVATHLHCYDYL
jgi:hypothetical protein